MPKYYEVTDTEYKEFIQFALNVIENYKKEYSDIQLVSIYRGSLGMGAHLSNLTGLPLNIVKFQSYDGNDKYPIWLTTNAGPGSLQILLDDIYDTGETIKKCMSFIEEGTGADVLPITMFGKNSPYPNWRHHDGESWYKFPWEQ